MLIGTAIALRSPLDKFAMGIYASELALWVGIMIAGLVYNLPRAIKRRLGPSTIEAAVPDEAETVEPQDDDQMSVFRSIHSRNRTLPTFRMRRRVAPSSIAPRSTVETGSL